MIYTGTNLVTNGSFDNGTTGWQWGNVYNAAIETPSGTSDPRLKAVLIEDQAPPLEDTKVYQTCSIAQSTSDTSRHRYFVHFKTTGDSRKVKISYRIDYPASEDPPSYVIALKTDDNGINTYALMSMRTPSGNYPVTITELSVGLSPASKANTFVTIDDIIVIDLTDIFGSTIPPASWVSKRYTLSGDTVSIPQYVAPVAGLKATSVGTNIITLGWTARENATYKIHRDGLPAFTDTTISTNTFTDTNLYQATYYTYYVTVIVDGVESDPVDISVTTYADQKPASSGQYAYRLLRVLQRHMRCDFEQDRVALLNVAGWMFNNPNVIITESAYNQFIEYLDQDIGIIAEKDLYNVYDIVNDDSFSSINTLLKKAFASIGITVTSDLTSYTFTLPNGDSRELLGSAYSTDSAGVLTLNMTSRTGVTDSYWLDIKHIYFLTDEEVLSTDDLTYDTCGDGTTWEWDGTNNVLTISGIGSIFGNTTSTADDTDFWTRLGMGIGSNAETVVIGAGVNSIGDSCFSSLKTSGVSYVCMQPENMTVALGTNWVGKHVSGSKSAGSATIYTDNLDIKNYDYSSYNFNATIKPLSEWGG